MSKNDPLFTSFLPKDHKKVEKARQAPANWFEAILRHPIPREELAALGLVSILTTDDPSVKGLEMVPLDSIKGRDLFHKMCKGSLRKEGYEELLIRLEKKSPLEKVIFRLSFHGPSSMKEFNQFVFRGAFYEGDEVIHLMPFALHELLKIQFGEDIQPITTLFGYSTRFQDWSEDQRPISIPCQSFPVPHTIHGVKADHPIEIFLHDTAHQILAAHIPKSHRLSFQSMGRDLYQRGEKEIAIYLVDMPFISYLDFQAEEAFEIAIRVAIYRTASHAWQNHFITELMAGTLSKELQGQIDVERVVSLTDVINEVRALASS